ncbi:alpha-1,2-galactosyltransferase [Erysiphe necator]|uniref:Putative alpha-mannosyltransferase subunit n=1 Tax=Uncinula necator TaxID=52586 RepID=A0A0B1PC40_UNCNE|nr:alpha-1,2-galactosyltransferase [Erysiphe necator]KHJ36252.1 putative alpha-mannosyltransferase subunit [Erysiphe necator]
MHLALPKKKISVIPTYNSRPPQQPILRRKRIQVIAVSTFAIGILIFIFSLIRNSSNGIRFGNPPVVIVTVFDYENYNNIYIEDLKRNRINYAKKHGYSTFFANITDYELNGAPKSWAQVPAIRHAISKYNQCMYVWYLNHNSVIMNPAITVDGDIMSPAVLEKKMLRNQPVVPPNSVIKTFRNLNGANVELVLTQDQVGLALGSYIIRRGSWSKFFLDVWFDPLYRSYNFQKAQIHALEHIIQWHPTILSKLALVPQRMLNSYSKPDTTSDFGVYREGDFVVELTGCEQPERNCATEVQPYLERSKIII